MPPPAEQLVGAHPRPAQEAPRAAPLTCASSKVCAANVLAGKAEGAAQEERLLRQQAADGSPAAHRPPAPHRPPLSALGGLPRNAAHWAHRRAFVRVSAAHYCADRGGVVAPSQCVLAPHSSGCLPAGRLPAHQELRWTAWRQSPRPAAPRQRGRG